jgi:hypothetical protein
MDEHDLVGRGITFGTTKHDKGHKGPRYFELYPEVIVVRPVLLPAEE